MIYSVIMAGGKGERFWPLSRSDCPKQLLKITSDQTLLEETLARIAGFIKPENIRIVAGSNIRDKIQETLTDFNPEHLYSEPFGRNTCLAIGFSALLLHRDDPDAVMIVLPSDHLIKPKETFINLLKVATEICAEYDWLITLGITPTRPETGYGYIEIGDMFDTINGVSIYRVAEFNEKPTRIVAQQYYYGRRHLWNSGMFIWSARSILKAIQKHKPGIYDELMKFSEKIGTPEEEDGWKELYNNTEDISIDYAVLEKANNVLTIQADMVWDDVGSWLALDRIRSRDKDNNVLVGDNINLGTYETIIYNDSDGLIATIGVSDLIIVRTDNIVMVAHKTQIGDIKRLLSKFGGDDKLEKYL